MADKTDEDLERFLDSIDQYETSKIAAAEFWKKAFLSLTQARLQADICSRQHDPQSTAATILKNEHIESSLTSPPSSFGGAWPTTALKNAQNYFLEALKHEVNASRFEQATKI